MTEASRVALNVAFDQAFDTDFFGDFLKKYDIEKRPYNNNVIESKQKLQAILRELVISRLVMMIEIKKT